MYTINRLQFLTQLQTWKKKGISQTKTEENKPKNIQRTNLARGFCCQYKLVMSLPAGRQWSSCCSCKHTCM